MNNNLEFKDLYYWESTEFMEFIENKFLELKKLEWGIEKNYREYLRWFDYLSDEIKWIYLSDYFNNKK